MNMPVALRAKMICPKNQEQARNISDCLHITFKHYPCENCPKENDFARIKSLVNFLCLHCQTIVLLLLLFICLLNMVAEEICVVRLHGGIFIIIHLNDAFNGLKEGKMKILSRQLKLQNPQRLATKSQRKYPRYTLVLTVELKTQHLT